MANYLRPRAEDEDIRDRANTSLDAGQAQVEQQADPAADPEADTSLQTRAAQYNLNEGKRQAYEAKVRTADARRRNRPGSEAWQNVANASGDKSAAQQATRKAAEARRDETVTADASTRLAQNNISRQREEQQLAAAQKREQDQQNAADLRKFEAAGGETQVDPATGEKAPAFHPDGAPRFKPGAIEGEKPRQQPTADAALASVPGMGAVMTLGGPIDQTTELVQPMRNDRGGIADVPLEQKTDPKTGEIYSETKDQFGQTQRVNLGQDTKIPRLNQIQTEIDTRAMELQALDVQRAQLEPAWKPVEENYKKAKTALDAPLEFIQENGKWVENTPQRFPADPEKLANWRQSRESTLQWYNNAAKSYGQQAPAMDNLQKQQQEIKLRHEQAQLQKKRVELDLPEQDGGVAATLTAAETGQLPSEEAATADYLKTLATGMPGFGDAFLTANGQASYQQLPALPDGIDLPKTRPIIPQDDPGKAAMISKAFNGVAAPDQLMLHDDGDGFTRVVRKDPNPKGTNHNSIGNMEIDKATGIPRMVLDPRWAPTDILSQVTFGNTDGIDIYLREPKNFTFNPAKEAEWAASIFDALSRNPDPKANNEIIESMSAGPEQILAKLKGGELSVKRAEALMQNLWGSTLKAEDPSAPGAFDKWLYQQTSKQNRDAWTAATVSRSTADKNAVLQTYMDEWQSRNAWKPGVTLQQRVDFEKKLKLTPRTTEQIAGLADSFAITAIQSVAMLSQLSTPVIAPVNAVLNPGDNTKWAEAVGRATANDTRMIGRTATRYATEEGKQAFAERDTIAELLRSTVMTQDVYPGGRESPEWKAAMDAAIRQATDNADKIHGWNREDGWEITREDLDPATNAHLRKLIDIYALTGNKDYLDSFMAAQLEDHGTRQTAKYQLDLAAGRNKYVAAWVQGTHASLYETATEVASTALTLGTGKVLFGAGKALTASKAAAHMVKLEKAAEAGSRLAKFRLAMHGIKADVLKAGMVPDTLANPATRLGKLGNAASKVGKFAVATGATGALEEGFMGLARPDASVPNILHDAMIGAIMEPLLGGIMSVPTVAIGSAIQQSKVSRNVAKFSDAYNREFNSSEGFVPITPQKAQAAMALFDGVNLNAFAQRLTESAANVKIAVEAAAADTAGPAEIQAMHAAQAAHREVIDSVSESIFSRLEAVQHVDSVQAEDRPLAYAIAKVAAGRADLVTPQERAAAAGALTPQGSPVFATAANGIDILTDEGRAHAMSRFPGVGMLIQTAESERMFQQQMAAVPAAATGQSDPNAAPAAAPDDVADTANIPRVAVTPEQQQQAAQVTAQVIAEIATEAPAIAARLSRGAGTVRVSGGVTASVGADGMPRIQIIEDDIAQSLAAGMTPAQVAARVKDNIVLHETIHTLQFQVAEQQQTAAGVTGDPATLSQDFYRGIHATMAAESPQMLENGRALYAENDDGSAPAWDTLPEWAQAAEVVRMLTEAKLAGRTTDISRLMDGASPGLLQKLAQIVKDMIAAITTGENIPESVKQHVDTLTELYNQLLNATPSPTNTRSTNPAANPGQSTPGQTAPGTGAAPQANSNRQPANNGGTQQTPGDNAGAPAATAEQQARVKATEIVRKEFDKAIASRPLLKKDADLMTGLREAAIDIVESHIGNTPAEIQDAAARAIGIYLQSPEVSEKLGALYAAQSDKAKAYRAAATARVKEEARRVIGQRMATVRDLIDSIGRITRPTNALELYRTGRELPPEWNGMLRSSDYAGGGKNAVVRAILGMIYAPDENSGSSPDSIAVGLEREFPDKYQGMTPDMLWTALGEEIRGYVNGADTSALDDPDADTSGMTDDQIQALADRHAKAAVVEKWRGITGKSLLPATAEAYEAEYQSIVAEQGENDFLDEEYQQQAVAAVDARKPATPEAPPKPKAASKPQGSPDASPPVEDDGSIFAAVDLGNEVVTTPTESDQAAAEKWVNSMPGFQGGKRPMAAPVTAAVRAAFSPEKRSSFRTIVDFFGGGGSWGLFHAMVNFDNVNRVVVYERNADRLLKIKLFHEKGNLVAGMLQQKNVQDILANAAAKMRQSATKSGSALAKRIDTSGISDPLLLGLFQAIRDYAENSYAGAKDKAGEQTPEQKIAISIRIVGEQAAEAYRLAEAFRQRGGKVDYRNADSYQAAPESGTDVLSIIDPPYYRTKGYTFEESIPDMASGEVTETVKENTVREDTYRLTRDLIQRSAAAGNAMIYTDSAFWKMEETEKRGKKTITHPPYFGMKEQHRRYYLPEGGRILSDIVDTFDSFGVVAGEIGAGRKEILGIHGHDITTQPGRRTRPQRNARNNEGQGSPDGRNDQPAGRGGNSGQAVPGMAGRTAAEASPLRSESGDPLNPGDEATLGSAPAQPRIRRSIGELESLAKSQEDFRFWFQDFKGFLETYLGPNKEYAPLVSEFLNATSAASTVGSNVQAMMKALREYIETGTFVSSFLPAHRGNLHRAQSGQTLSGPKISEYSDAVFGIETAVPVDRHIAQLLFNTDKPTKSQIAAAKIRVAKVGLRLGWTPRQTMATLWAANIARNGRTPQSYEKYLQKHRYEIKRLLTADREGNQRGLKASRRIAARIEQRRSDERAAGGLPAGDARLGSAPVQADRRPGESGKDYYQRITQAPVVRFEQSRIVHHTTGEKAAEAIAAGQFQTGADLGVAEKRGAVYFADEDVNPGIYARNDEGGSYEGQQARTLPIDIRGLALLNNEYAPDQGYPNHQQYGNNRIRGEFDMLPPGVDGYISFLDDGRIYEVALPAQTANKAREQNRLFSAPAQATAEFKRAFTPLDPKNPFGDWSASTTEPGILTGYRGENGNGQADNNFGSSEGVGLYLAKTRQDTEFFGKARQVNFPKPKNPLVVDQDATGEPIPLLQEDNEAIWDHIWSHKPSPQDSDWIKAHVLAAKQLGMTQENSEGWDTKLPRALTDILLTMGYDAVYVRSGGMQWVNILAKPGQRFNRGTRSAAGTALYSAPAQNPTAQYRYLKDKEAKAGLTPAEQQALLQSEKAMGQSFAIDMDDPALKSRSKGSVSPSFQPQLNLQRQHPVTGQQLALFSAPAQQGAARHAVLEAKHNSGTITPAEREEAQRIVGNAARAAGHDVEAWHGSPDFKGDAFDRKYFGRNTGLSRGGFSFTTDKAAAEGYMKGAVDQSQAMVDSANDVMRELQDRIDGGMEWTGPFDEESAPEFRSDMVDDIEDAAGYMLDLAKTMPSDLAGKLRAASKLNSTDPTPRLIHAFLKNPTRIDVAGKELLQVQNPTDAKSAEPFTGVPLSERFNPQSPSILMSAPAQPVDDAAALDAALKGMDPIYLKVFQASQRTPTPTPQDLAAEFRLPERAIANIIGTARTRIMAHGRTIRPGGLTPARTADGRLKGGMPERANSTTPILAAVDQIQQQEGLPLGKTANEIHTAGYAILQRPDATQHLLDAHLNGIPNEGQIFATAQLLLEAGIKGEQSPALTELALLYRQRGTEQSDAFRARIDIHRTPAERNALIFQELFTSPNKQVQKAWREAKTPEQKAAILQEWNARVKGVKEALKARGLDLQDAMDRLASQRTDAKAAESEASAAHQKLVDALQADVARLKAQLAAATDEAAKQAAQTQVDAAQQKADQAATLDPANTIRLELQKLTKPERAAIEDLRDGGTWESAASNSFLSVPEVKRVFDKFADALDDAGARAILLAEDILLDNQARLNSPAANAMSREDRAREGAAAIRKALGYDRNLIDRRSKGIEPKPKKGTAKKPAVARPEPADMTDAQFQSYLDNPQTWRSLWQAEMIVTGEETSFDQWINKPETRARKTRLTRMSQAPVSTTTGELDMHDPISVKRAFDEFNIHNASLFDKAVAIWRMGILSGLHTGIVNFGGNVAHSQYNLWPRRLMEAGVNNVLSALGLGSKEAATFGELKYMAQAQHKAMARAGTAMAMSWNMDTRIVESEVLALGTQLEFSGIGADYIPKAVGGPLGKLLHAISFRHMTAADEMIKAYHSQTEVMAQAYRMAKAEKLTGQAFDQRMDELLEYGSQAWRKAMDSATWVTFQNEVDPKNPRSLAIFDRAANGLRRLAHTDTGKTKEIINGKGQKVTVPIMKPNVFAFFFPFINTPLNIMKIGIEMSPVGAFFSTVDALRALKIRIENKSISPEQSRIEASELYNRLRLVQDLTNQIIGMGMFYALGSLVKPDDDEELPWITGSTDWKSTSKGDRDLRARVMPAYTLRVPFTDAMLTYQRIEPFGTALGFIIDARIAVNRKGWSDEALGEFMATAINQFNDKTYMKGLSDLMTVWNDPERIGTRLTSSIVTGFVPNLIRQPIREADPYMRDTKPGADVGFVEGVWHNIKYSLAPGYAPIAQDVWGNPIKRHPGQQFGNVHTDVLLRVFDPTNLTVRDQIDPLDLYLFNWNNTAATPKERFNIEPIQKNLQIDRGGKTTTVQLSPEDHAAANRNAGQAARQFLGNDWDASNPQPQQVERVKEVLQKFQKRERDRLRDKYRSALPEE